MQSIGVRRAITALGAVAAIALGCESSPVEPVTEAAFEVGPAGASEARSIRGELAGRLLIGDVPDTELHRLDVNATGSITHVGRVSATWALPQVVFDLRERKAISLVGTWSGAIVTAAGERIDGRYDLRSLTVPVRPNGDFAIVADVTILSGTGRFAGATGSGVSYVRGNAITGSIRVEVTGRFVPAP